MTISFNNRRLFVGSIPKNRDRDDLFQEFSSHARKFFQVLHKKYYSTSVPSFRFRPSRRRLLFSASFLIREIYARRRAARGKASALFRRFAYSDVPPSTSFMERIRFRVTAGLMEVIIYSSPDDKKKNRGFCFLEYDSHKAASLAKRRLGTGRIKVSIRRSRCALATVSLKVFRHFRCGGAI